MKDRMVKQVLSRGGDQEEGEGDNEKVTESK
jgi:hypothetical protein